MKKSLMALPALLTAALGLAALLPCFDAAAQPGADENQSAGLTYNRYPGYFSERNPFTQESPVLLRFSHPVDPQRVSQFVVFYDRENDRTGGLIAKTPTVEEVVRFRPHLNEESRRALALENYVLLRPALPLSIGSHWGLLLNRGLASKDRSHTLQEDRLERLGTLNPFRVRSVQARSPFDGTKSIRIETNKPSLDPTFTPERLADFVSVSPAPQDLEIKTRRHSVDLSGSFDYDTRYAVTVRPGLVGNDRISLTEQHIETVTFSANDGFVTLPAFSTTQSALGHRVFDVQTGNLDSLRVRTKKLTGDTLLFALKSYDEEYEGWGGDRTIPFDIVAGRIAHDRVIEPQAGLDESETISLNWDELGGGEKVGAFYFCAEGDSRTEDGPAVGAQAIIQLTDIGLAWKQTGDETVFYAFSLHTGAPLNGVVLELFDETVASRAQVETNADGVARLSRDHYEEVSGWLDARHGEDRHVMRFFEELDTVGLWSFSVPYRYDDPSEGERRTLLFTDRGVYRPGDEVHLKVISRFVDGDQLLPGGGGKARLKVQDSRGRAILDKDVTLGEHGSCDETIFLPDGGLGYYSVELDFNHDLGEDEDRDWRKIFHHSFQVEEYRVNTFEVTLDSEDSVTGLDVSVPLSAKYYMGKPLADSLVTWSAYASESYSRPRGFDEFAFGDNLADRDFFRESGELHLDDEGRTVISFALPPQEASPGPRSVTVTADITDANQQTVGGRSRFTVHSSDFYLGMQIPDGVYRAGDTISLALAAVTPGGEVHSDPVETVVKIEKETWNTVKVQGAGGRITHRNERFLDPVSEDSLSLVTGIDAETGIARAQTHDVTFAEAGDYVVTLEAADESGRKVLTRTQVTVIGVDEPSWSWHDVLRIDVIPDKNSYRAGDIAKLLVRSPVFGHALLTTERAGVRSTRTLTISEHETIVEVPIDAGDAPNLFTSIMIIRGSEDSPHKHRTADYRMGYCQLDVEDPAGHLEVNIDNGPLDYVQPGQRVESIATVNDHEGNPVAGAEITFYAVDEGVLSLTGYQTPEPADTFFEAFPLNVWTGQSIGKLLPENPNEQSFDNKGYVIGGGGFAEGLDPDRVRKDFKAVAFWEGSAITGPDGRVTATFAAPDNLTTFRVMAVVAAGNRFGDGEAPLTINKPLIIEPSLPRFSNVADQVDLLAVLHNNTGDDQEIEIAVELDEHAVFLKEIGETMPTNLTSGEDLRKRVRRLTLGAGATETVRLPVGMAETGEATWNWQVRSLSNPDLRDATESKLEIGYPMPLLRETQSVAIRNDRELQNLLDSINPRLLEGRGSISLELSNSRLIEAADGLDYLLRYPYGCVEQTTSSTIPWLSTRNMRDAMPGMNRSDEEIASTIAKGVERLFSMQTNDGGLGYWPGASQSVLWGSAYGGVVIAMAQQQGIPVPAAQAEALWKYLSQNLRNAAEQKKAYELSQRCLAAYTLALAGRAEPSYHEVLFEKRKLLPSEARSLLALAMIETGAAGQPELQPRLDALLADEGLVPTSEVAWYGRPYETATRLLAEVRRNADAGEVNDLIDELMRLRQPVRGWGSTYSNAWPLLALSAYSGSALGDLSANEIEVRYGGESDTVVLEAKPSTGGVSYRFEGDATAEPLSLSIAGSGPVYARLEVATQPELAIMAPENKGFGITRTYHEVNTDGTLREADDLMVGDLVLVKLDINLPKQREPYLAIDDALPSLFEAVNPNFETQGNRNVQRENEGEERKRRLYTNHRELREDRALFFADYVFREGDYTIHYLARVVSAGHVTAPPAKIEAMYEPQRFGLSGTQKLSARPLDLGTNRVAAR